MQHGGGQAPKLRHKREGWEERLLKRRPPSLATQARLPGSCRVCSGTQVRTSSKPPTRTASRQSSTPSEAQVPPHRCQRFRPFSFPRRSRSISKPLPPLPRHQYHLNGRYSGRRQHIAPPLSSLFLRSFCRCRQPWPPMEHCGLCFGLPWVNQVTKESSVMCQVTVKCPVFLENVPTL